MADSTLFTAGALFSTDYLVEAIKAETAYKAVDAGALRARLVEIADAFPKNAKTNESQTEDDFIWPVLDALGWKDSLRQQNLTVTGRDDVPDGLLFADAAAKATANVQDDQWRRYAHGLAVVESKRWARPLDRASGRDETTAPSTQMLRYTAHDLAPFARDLGHVDDAGDVLTPFVWDEERRLELRAKLDALYFILYGVFDPADPTQSRDDIRYIYSTFPIVEREEIAKWGAYRSRELALAWINALMAGQPDAEIAG